MTASSCELAWALLRQGRILNPQVGLPPSGGLTHGELRARARDNSGVLRAVLFLAASLGLGPGTPAQIKMRHALRLICLVPLAKGASYQHEILHMLEERPVRRHLLPPDIYRAASSRTVTANSIGLV